MADYTQPPVAEKRVRFFDGQFLQDQDFIDEQKYHLDRVRRQNRLLHVIGVADGLKVSSTKANQVKVTKGVAVDSLGRQLVLADDRTIDLLPAPKFNNQQAVSLYILYQETAVDLATTGSKSERRWLEKPQIVAATTGGESTEPWDNQTSPVLLARLNLDNNGTVTVDDSVTQYAGLSLPGSVGIGATNPENADGWDRVLDLLGNRTTKLSVRTGSIDARILAHDDGWWNAPTGMIVGTRTNHPLSFGTNANVRMTINAAGNVGIGATNPENADGWDRVLDLLGSRTTKLSVRTGNIDARILAHDDGWWNAPTGMIVGTGTNHPLSFGTNANVRMTINAAGNVGIGTTNPENADGWNRVLDLLGNKHAKLSVRTGNIDARILANDDGWRNAPTGMIVGTETNHPVSFETNANARMTINAAGSVGIGTTAPTAKLEVNGDLKVSGTSVYTGKATFNGDVSIAGNATVKNVFLGDVGFGGHWAGFSHAAAVSTTTYGFLHSADGQYALINKKPGEGYIALRVGNADKLVLTDAGYVGIGIANPSFPLQIRGGPWNNFGGGTSFVPFGLYVEANVAAAGYHTASDARIKLNPMPIDPLSSLATLMDLTVYEFEYIPEIQPSSAGKKYHGFLAQEVEKVIPEAVSIVGDQRLDDNRVIEGLRVVANDRIFSETVGAIQALYTILQKQETRIRELEGQHTVDQADTRL